MDDDGVLEKFAADYAPGTVLFHEGDDAKQMYVIQSGSVEIIRHIGEKDRVIAVLPAGEFFGEMSIVNNRPRSATARVREPARLLVIETDTFEAMLRGKTEVAVRMIKTMAGRLERANQQIELLLLTDSNHRVVQCLRQLAEEHVHDHPDEHNAILLRVTDGQLAARVALPESEVTEILGRLALAGLIAVAKDADIEGQGYVLPEVGRLLEFLEFLELKERFGKL